MARSRIYTLSLFELYSLKNTFVQLLDYETELYKTPCMFLINKLVHYSITLYIFDIIFL